MGESNSLFGQKVRDGILVSTASIESGLLKHSIQPEFVRYVDMQYATTNYGQYVIDVELPLT